LAPILKLEKDDSEKELEFEIDYQLSLTIQQRFEMMFRNPEKWHKCWLAMDIENLLKLLNENDLRHHFGRR